MTVRYLHVIHSLDPERGGLAEGVRQVAAAVVRMGHQVEVAVLDPPASPWIQGFPCPVHALGPGYLGYGMALGLVPWLRENVGRFDAVVIDGIWQFHSFATWLVLHDSTVPYYVFTHGMLDPWFKRQYPLKHLKKLVYWQLTEHRVLRDARAVLFTAEEEMLLARQSFRPYRPREVVVNYGTPGAGAGDAKVQRELLLHRFPELRGKRLLLFLGRIHPKKGCDLLIKALAPMKRRHSDLHLAIAGPDYAGTQVQLSKLARECGVESSVTWTGMLRGDLKAGAFRAAEVFVLPSHQENFGIAVAEALSYGVPVLISNKVNIWREIHSERAGFVADDTVAGAEQLLSSWLALSAEQRAAMSQNAARCFGERFHIDATAKALIALFSRDQGAATSRLVA